MEERLAKLEALFNESRWTLQKFKYSVCSTDSFPSNGGGNVIFQREWLIKKTAKLVLQKTHSKFGSYYWRAPVGSGKSVFLKLLGKELQEGGCDV